MEAVISLHEIPAREREVQASLAQGKRVLVQRDDGVRLPVADLLDYDIMVAVASHFDGPPEPFRCHKAVLYQYLNREITVGKTAKRLNIDRTELIERFTRLDVPVRIGPDTLEEIRAEMRAARRKLGDRDA